MAETVFKIKVSVRWWVMPLARIGAVLVFGDVRRFDFERFGDFVGRHGLRVTAL